MLNERRQNIPARKSKPHIPATTPTEIPQAWPENDERYYQPVQMPRSVRRYRNTEGDEVIERGKKRLIIHREPLPSPRKRHGLLFMGLGMGATVILLVASNWAVSSWQAHQIDATYGYPRTWQTDAVVGHNDSPLHPTHFIVLNLYGQVVIEEIPGRDIAHTRIYSGPMLFGQREDQVPITLSFEDVNGDGKVDMVVHIQDKTIIYLNDGTKFNAQTPQ